jgi:hypothetical protein
MSSVRTSTGVSSASAPTSERDVTELTLDRLRARRRQARGQMELAQLRARQTLDADLRPLEALRQEVDRLTAELIRRYERDPALIDVILDEPAPDLGQAP